MPLARQRRTVRPAGVALALAACAILFSVLRAPAQDCTPDTVETELSGANVFLNALFGRGYGQVVLARDTLVRSVSFWRAGVHWNNPTPIHFFITEVDSSGEPITSRILQDGPVLSLPPGDSLQPSPYRFVFDPPVVLPRPDRYFFVVREELCVSNVPLLADTLNPYPDGQVWKTIPNFDCLRLGGVSGTQFPTVDLIFEVEFCDTSGTPTRRTSWGQVKSSYR